MHPATTADQADEAVLLPAVLACLTVVSGFVDAVSYIGLGHVFTANMTGNVVVLGFAAARTPGFSLLASGVSLTGFLVGAVTGGRLAVHLGARRRWVGAALAVETAGTAVATAIAALAPLDQVRYAVIGVLALAMGCRNAMTRRVGLPDLTTTVLTGTLTGLAAESSAAGGANPRFRRRLGSVALMFTGALAGAWLLRLCGLTTCLVADTGAVLAVLLGYLLATHRRAR
ncbi:YoaK family protein [Streptomyces orinoci]|uniref:YoaK family protein n=1 Tax=Streptomyces orinoci TaxID=67339 RepID=A0ABV3JRX8_STRON|nr:YoaK family protein [Streptomyces orinoci]